MILLKSQKMELISSLSSGLVHELNNNLSIILGNVELLDRKLVKESEIVSGNISNIKVATQKANETLNHLLTISNKQTNSFKKVDLNELFIDVFSIVRNSFTKSIDLNLSITEEEAIVLGDLSQLEHMLLNILINSYQAILNKGNFRGVIELRIIKVNKKNIEYWKIEITDNGIGIPQNIIPMVFDPFFSTKSNNNDLGLGLTSSKNILKAHNGFLEIDSVENKGTKVSLFLPVYVESIADEDNQQSKSVNISNTILLIDDEPLILTTAKAILEEFGHKVITSSNGEEGISIYQKNINDIALVILDMDMPNKSGQDVFYELKKINSNIKVIISSGYENDERVRDVLSNGVKGFIPKPYGINVFISKVNKVLVN
jgi:CheY-like chemotaxis protein